jgi:hypothetical protein
VRIRQLRTIAIIATAAVTILAGQLVVRAAPAYAGTVPGTFLTMVEPDVAQPGTVVADQGDRRHESFHFVVGMTDLSGRDPFANCLEAEPRTLDGRNGGIVQINPCVFKALTVFFWQWGWQFEPTSVNGLFRIRMGDKCLDADNAFGIRNGDRVQLWDCLGPGQLNQYWWLVNNHTGDTIAIRNDANGKCLLIDSDQNFAPYSRALIWDCYWLDQGGIMGQQFTPRRVTWAGEQL